MFFGGGGDPFEHFAGGMPGGGGGGRRGPAKDVDTTKLYESLGIEKTADGKEIKKAYRKLAVRHHPDKGGDEAMFKEISAAYEILSDPEKRQKYDKYGLEGVTEDGGGGGKSADDLFSMFFGGSQGGRNAGPRKGENVNHPIKVSLEDLYNGKTVKLAINRQKIIGDAKSCNACDGQGVVVELRQIALGMVQQVQRRCTSCAGEGYQCKTEKERKVLEVVVDKGMKNGQKVVFHGLADEKPNMEAGDINFIIQEGEHATFKRKGADLLITKRLSLNEALCGFEWSLTHLDGRDIIIKSRPGEVIKPETSGGQPFVKVVMGEGMPSHGNPYVKGHLYVLFSVAFPSDNELDAATVKKIKGALPDPCVAIDYDEDETEVVHLDSGDVKSFGKGGAASQMDAYDSDEEGPNGPGNVQCQQS
mmetsp:Transcript_15322/g.18148  ORF Transcript_15322/g.18148 Transcript_15322/m.18148 type:complete len:418 (-) Transcript_15322:312-1565(-)|eukprot:CAMPEP_0198248708 /NCGR_PEP_ID=MMETSP1447-20131203/431_1 /TAXON_ID=420782 /ORGANISM="Chaetoceros dichaeta, Strain CCMP1751" /LENGTH=417 /DNA_ID=CAMNT_0043933183 /DNA_START=77 /DNA_END=1330 /DNA_ORIENTATION=+